MNAVPEPQHAGLSALATAFAISVRSHPHAAFLLDLDGRFLAVNPELCRRLQTSEAEVIGRTFHHTVESNDFAFVLEQFERARDGEPVQYEATGTRPDSTIFLARVTNYPVHIDGEIVAVVGIAVDVSHQQEELTRQRASEDLLRLAGRMARFGGWSVDAESRRVMLTDGALRMFGFADADEYDSLPQWSPHAAEDRARFTQLLQRCLTDGDAFDIESNMIARDGSRLRVHTIGEAERDESGSIVRARGAVWDITDYAIERERAQYLDERLSASLSAISDGLMFLDTDWKVSFVNPTAELLLGRSHTEFMGNDLWQLYPNTVGTDFEQAFREAERSRNRVIHREWVERTQLWVDVTIYPIDTGLVVHLRDTTDDVAAREREIEHERQLQQQAALLDISRDAIVVRGLDDRVQYWNRAAAELYGWPAAEAVGQLITDLIYHDPIEMRTYTAEVLRESYWAGELEQRTRSGTTIIADCRWQLLNDEGGQPRAILCVNTDITAYRKEQEARARGQRMESLGTLAGGIAHDLNNVLTPVLMSIQLLALDESDEQRLELLSTVETSVKRGATMIKQVLAFARGLEGRREPIDMDALIDDLVAYAVDAVPSSITVDVSRPESLPDSTGDVTQLMQVLVNLVVNARDAMPGGGRLRITAEVERLDEAVNSVSHDAQAGDYVVIAVEDNGTGMPPDVVTRVFEPFFTTKETGQGTGLGLSTALAIVRSHGGFMQVYSEPEHGTRFRVGMPLAAKSSRPRPEPNNERPLPRGNGELVLVVDDEAAIRQVACRTLEMHGYRAASAANGREAIDFIESGSDSVDLVLTDLMMPVMDGAATTAYLEDHHPEIPIIAASGLAANGDPGRSIGLGVSRFLPKPYTTSLLLTTLHDTLHERALRRTESE